MWMKNGNKSTRSFKKNRENGNSPHTRPSMRPYARLLIRGRKDIRAILETISNVPVNH